MTTEQATTGRTDPGAPVRKVDTSQKKELANFIRLERSLWSKYPRYVSEVDSDVMKRLSGRSAGVKAIELAPLVVSRNGEDVARCVPMINRDYQKAKQDTQVGFIGYFAAAEGVAPEVQALLRTAERWLRDRGVTRVIAPYNGSATAGMGLRTADFDDDPIFPTPWQPPYMSKYVEDAGYGRKYPAMTYVVDFTSEKYRAAVEKARTNTVVTVRPINKKKWAEDMEHLRTGFNEAFLDEWEFQPFTSEEFREFFDPMKPILDARQLLLAEVDGKVAGFCLGMPDWSPLFRSFKGKMGPLQIVSFMLRAGKYRRAGLLGIGVLPEFRGKGIAHVLATTLYSRYQEKGLQQAFYYPVNEHNTVSRSFAESMGGVGRVIFHCYEKSLSDDSAS